jgi:cyclin H
MTYHGQNISRTAMFLACKTENAHHSVEQFATNFKKVTSEQILAPEYLLVQGLRFNFDVKHPFRALKGGHLELIEVVRGTYAGPNHIDEDMIASDLAGKLLELPNKKGQPTKTTSQDMEKRITDAYGLSSHILKTAALLTDAYFLYTPSQIWLAAHLLADEPLTLFYLSLKLPPTSPLYNKIISVIRQCAALLSSHSSYLSTIQPKPEVEAREAKHKAQVKSLIEKLKSCRDPDKVDLVKLNQAQKRDAVNEEEDQVEESKAKRRKLDRETYEKEAENFWGPELKK